MYLDRLKRWANRNLRKFSRRKVLLLERNYFVHQYKLRLSAGKQLAKEDPRGHGQQIEHGSAIHHYGREKSHFPVSAVRQ